jgi:hypothetical protein
MANHFLELFGERIKGFWDLDEPGSEALLKDILQHANTNPQKFRQDIEPVLFDEELEPLPIILEALSKDTDTWGQFYVDILHKIVEEAQNYSDPSGILFNLLEFTYIENDHRPFVQKIVDRIYKETDSENLSIKLAAVSTLPPYLKNTSIKNRSLILESLQQKLHDKNWKVRYVSFKALEYENLLPAGSKLSIADKIRTVIFGRPPVI